MIGSAFERHLNATVCPSIVADRVHPFMTWMFIFNMTKVFNVEVSIMFTSKSLSAKKLRLFESVNVYKIYLFIPYPSQGSRSVVVVFLYLF